MKKRMTQMHLELGKKRRSETEMKTKRQAKGFSRGARTLLVQSKEQR